MAVESHDAKSSFPDVKAINVCMHAITVAGGAAKTQRSERLCQATLSYLMLLVENIVSLFQVGVKLPSLQSKRRRP